MVKPVSVGNQAFLNNFRPSRIPAFSEEQEREVGVRAGIRGDSHREVVVMWVQFSTGEAWGGGR